MGGELDRRIDEENKLREWGKNLCGINMDISELEEINVLVRTLNNTDILEIKAKRGKAHIFKTQSGLLVNAQRYIFGLESTVIRLDTERAELQARVDTFTNYGFFDLMKLAFKRLTNRRTHG